MILRNLLLALGALALLAGVVLIGVWYGQPSVRMAAPSAAQARQSILAAGRPIPAGTLLRPEDLRWLEIPASQVSPAYLVRGQFAPADYEGAVARRGFAADEPLVASGLVRRSERGFLAAALRPGMRAVAVAVDAPQSAAGLILPGDRVDAILTQNFGDTAPAPHRSVGETILRNLRVVAIDQWMTPTSRPVTATGPGATDSRIAKTLTLEVSEIDAEKIMVAAELGKIGFSLRALQNGTADVSDAASPPIWAADVSQAFSSSRPNPSLVPHAPRVGESVEVIRGTTAQSQTR